MQSDIGRFLQELHLDTQKTIRVVYDACFGQGADVSIWIEGKELVFGNKGENTGMGFIRVRPLNMTVILSFPRGHEIPDPQKKMSGVINSAMRMTLHWPSDVNTYVRRLIDVAYALES